MILPPAAEVVQAKGLAWCLDEWDTWIATIQTSPAVQIVDRIEKEQAPGKAQHKSVWVDANDATNTHRMRDRAIAEMRELVTVGLLWRIAPLNQKATQRECFEFSDLLVRHCTARAFHPEWQISIEAIRRGAHPASSEWFVVQHTFAMRRYAMVGG